MKLNLELIVTSKLTFSLETMKINSTVSQTKQLTYKIATMRMTSDSKISMITVRICSKKSKRSKKS